MCESSYQYIGKSVLKFYASIYILRVKLKFLSNGLIYNWGCVFMYLVEDNIVTYLVVF